MTRAATLAALLLGTAGCVLEEGPMMEPGEDCLECHDGGEARRWTVAGTWPPQGRRITVVDQDGKAVTLHANKVGNFWSAEPFTFPLRSVDVDGTSMPTRAGAEAFAQGSCNRCHGEGGGDD